MVIVLPPGLSDTIIDIRVIVTILRQSIVNQNGVQLVWTFFVLDVWRSDDLFEFLDFDLKSFNLRRCCLFIFI